METIKSSKPLGAVAIVNGVEDPERKATVNRLRSIGQPIQLSLFDLLCNLRLFMGSSFKWFGRSFIDFMTSCPEKESLSFL